MENTLATKHRVWYNKPRSERGECKRMAYGRPLKGGSRRTPITVHAPYKIIELIDAYVDKRVSEGEVYSRSDFYNEAVLAKLAELGIQIPDEERTKSVPVISEAESTGNNADNWDKNGTEKTSADNGR